MKQTCPQLFTMDRARLFVAACLLVWLTRFSTPAGAASIWTGLGDGVSWNLAENWLANLLPNALDDVVIEGVSTSVTIVVSENVTVRSLRCSASLSVAGGDLSLTHGASQVGGTFTIGAGRSLSVSGLNTLFVATGPAIADNANLFASAGAAVTVPGLASYQTAASSNPTWQAIGVGSRLSLPGLKSIIGPQNCFNYLKIRARDGGLVELPAVATIGHGYSCFGGGGEHGVLIGAEGTNSIVDLTGLRLFQGSGEASGSSMESVNGGRILVPSLGQAVGLSLSAFGGTVFSLPGLTNFDNGSASSCRLSAVGVGSLLSLPGLRTITGPRNCFKFLGIHSQQGGVVDLSSVATIGYDYSCFGGGGGHGVVISADGTNSLVDLTGLGEFAGSEVASASRLETSHGGRIHVPNLGRVTGLNLSASDGLTVSLPRLTNYNNGLDSSCGLSASGNGSVLDLPSLRVIAGPRNCFSYLRIEAFDGGLINLPEVEVIGYDYFCFGGSGDHGVVVVADGTGTVIDLRRLQRFNGSGVQSASSISARGGARVQLHYLQSAVGLTSVVAEGTNSRVVFDGDDHMWLRAAANVQFRAERGGLLDLSGMQGFLGVGCSFTADGSGSEINLLSLSAFVTSTGASVVAARNGGSLRLGSRAFLFQNVTIEGADHPILPSSVEVGPSLTFFGTAWHSYRIDSLDARGAGDAWELWERVPLVASRQSFPVGPRPWQVLRASEFVPTNAVLDISRAGPSLARLVVYGETNRSFVVQASSRLDPEHLNWSTVGLTTGPMTNSFRIFPAFPIVGSSRFFRTLEE